MENPMKSFFANHVRRADADGGEPGEVRIGKGRIMKIPSGMRDLRVVCASGMIWLTRENDPVDHVVEAHASLCISGPGLVVIEALEDSAVQIRRGRGRGLLLSFPSSPAAENG